MSRLSDPPTQDEASNDESAKDTDEENPGSAASRLSRRTKQIFGAVAALIAILVSATTLFDWLWDKVSDPPPVKAENISARIESAERQLDSERLGDFMEGTRQPTDEISEADLNEIGTVWGISARIRGAEGKRIWVYFEVIDAASGEHLDFPWADTQTWFTPVNQNHRGETRVWVPYPPTNGRYQVRFSLLNPDYSPLTSGVVREMPPEPAGVP